MANFSSTSELKYLRKKQIYENRWKRNIHENSLLVHQESDGGHNQAAASSTIFKPLHIRLLSSGSLFAYANCKLQAGLLSGVKQLSGTSGPRTGDLELDRCGIPKRGLKSSSDLTKVFIFFTLKSWLDKRHHFEKF